jgi:hypothetical protein
MEIEQGKRSHRRDRERDGTKTLKWLSGVYLLLEREVELAQDRV